MGTTMTARSLWGNRWPAITTAASSKFRLFHLLTSESGANGAGRAMSVFGTFEEDGR